MPIFTFFAVESLTGKECRGSVAGQNRAQVASELKNRGLALISLAEEPATAPRQPPLKQGTHPVKTPLVPQSTTVLIGMLMSRQVLSRKGLVVFTRQLATLVRAGLPIHRALAVLARSERRQAVKDMLGSLAAAIQAGGSFSDGLQQLPRIFDRLYINMVKAGEAGGVLDTVLDRLARLLERTERMRSRVKAAMTYPLIILVVAGCILAGLGVFVVPKFEQIFNGLLRGQPLPSITRLVLSAGNFACHHAAGIAGLMLLLWLAWRFFRQTERGQRAIDRLMIRTPVLGDLVLKAAIARFARTMGSLLASGVPILETMGVTRETGGNRLVAEALNAAQARVMAGATVARSLEATEIFPHMVTSMIEVGEETGALPEMLVRIADSYDEEMDQAIGALTSIIEPVMIVLMALVVGVVVIALFLPIITIVQHL
jgi:type IV pilus assembly protein PilC